MPAVALARRSGLFDGFDGWTNRAVDAVVESDDPVCKKLLWVVLLSVVPEVQQWLDQNAPPLHRKWTDDLYSRVKRFATGAVVVHPDEEGGAATSRRRVVGSKDKREKDRSHPLLYSGVDDFLYSEVALYLASV